MPELQPHDATAEAAAAATAETTTAAEAAELADAPLRPLREAAAAVGAVPVAASIKEGDGGGGGTGSGDRAGVSSPDADGMVTVTLICRLGPNGEEEPAEKDAPDINAKKRQGGLGEGPCIVIDDPGPEEASPDIHTQAGKSEKPQAQERITAPEAEDYAGNDAKTPPEIKVNATFSDGTVDAIEEMIKTM